MENVQWRRRVRGEVGISIHGSQIRRRMAVGKLPARAMGSESCLDRSPSKSELPNLTRRSNSSLDLPRCWRTHSRDFGQAQRKLPAIVLPEHLQAHGLASLIVEAGAVVFIKREFTVRAGVDVDAKRIIRLLLRVPLDGPHRHESTGPQVQGQRFEIDRAINLTAPF